MTTSRPGSPAMIATSLTRRLLQGLRRPRRAAGVRPDFGDCGAELALDMTLAARPARPAVPGVGLARGLDPDGAPTAPPPHTA